MVSFGYPVSFRLSDLGRIAYLGPYGISKTILFLSRRFSSLTTGFIYHYAFVILIALVFFILFFFTGNLLFSNGCATVLYFIFISTFFYLMNSPLFRL
jgi:hypothetical protein